MIIFVKNIFYVNIIILLNNQYIMTGLNSANSSKFEEIDYNELFLAIQSWDITPIETKEIFYYNKNWVYQSYSIAHGTSAIQIKEDLEKDWIKFCDADWEKYLASNKHIKNMNSQSPGSVVEAVTWDVFSLVNDSNSF